MIVRIILATILILILIVVIEKLVVRCTNMMIITADNIFLVLLFFG